MDEDAFNSKIKKLAEVIDLMYEGQGPDLLGICEIENKDVAERLKDACSRKDDFDIAILILGIFVESIHS
ncbi:MAG: hypothetical protein ACMUIU_17500 [bacterium]